MIYKILRAAEWQSLQSLGFFKGSGDDARDGFIHLSAADQVAGTLAKYFASEPSIWLLPVDPDKLPADALVWEESRGGVRFPHLYADLSLAACAPACELKQADDGNWPGLADALRDDHD